MNQKVTMKEIPSADRPYEKCEKLGAGALSDTELLAVLLRTGTRGENALELASRILYHNGESGILGIHQFSIERLKKIHGVGRVKAVQLSCISELAKRLSKASAGELLSFENPDSIARYYMEDLRHEKQEIMKLLMLNSKSKLIGETNISKGTVNASLITPRELFIEALQKNILSGRSTAIYGILITNIWKSVAIPTVLVISALQTIPGEIIEAAIVDGANGRQRFFYITLRYILPILSIIFVLVLKEGLMIYDYIMAMTSGGPAGATESITLSIYRIGFEDMKFGYAISQAMIVAVIIAVISITQIRFTDKKKIYD